jgi:hypothetical protein
VAANSASVNETGSEPLALAPVSGALEDAGMDNVDVRRARHDDADAIADVYLATFTATYGFPLAHNDQQVRRWIAEILLPNEEV